jgi:hypothetical protein
VPLLRRSFADFSRYDRRKLMELVRGAGTAAKIDQEQKAVPDDPVIEDLLQWI